MDADLDSNANTKWSITKYVYIISGITISWVSQLQKIMALSTNKIEYVATMEANKEMI